MEKDLISVIVPVYKVEKYLSKCIDSIINQTYQNLEILLLDDGSPDNCGKICDEYAKRDDRITVVHKKNTGVSDTRNIGIDIAKGKYIGLVDSDDYLAPDMYEKMYKILIENDTDMCICNYIRVKGSHLDDEGLPLKDEIISGKDLILNKMLYVKGACWVLPSNKLYKKELFKKVKFPLNKRFEDEFVLYQFIWNSKKVGLIEEGLYYYVDREDSFVNSGFSYENLYAVEAAMERAMFIEKNASARDAVEFFMNALVKFTEVYQNLDLKNDKNKKKAKELKKTFNQLYRRLVLYANLKRKLQFTLFYLFPAFYGKLTSKL